MIDTVAMAVGSATYKGSLLHENKFSDFLYITWTCVHLKFRIHTQILCLFTLNSPSLGALYQERWRPDFKFTVFCIRPDTNMFECTLYRCNWGNIVLTSPIERLPSPADVGAAFHRKISLCAQLRTPEMSFKTHRTRYGKFSLHPRSSRFATWTVVMIGDAAVM
jgi:hypothetical protein